MNMLTQNVHSIKIPNTEHFIQGTTRIPYGPSHKFLWSKYYQNRMKWKIRSLTLTLADPINLKAA